MEYGKVNSDKIKFEDKNGRSNDDEGNLDSYKAYLDGKTNLPGRITFEDSKKEGQQDVSKKRKTRRKPRVRPLPQGSSLNHNAPDSSFGYPGYLNGGFPPGYPDSGDYPSGYPVYPTPNPTSLYPDPQHPVSLYQTPFYSRYSVEFPGGYPGNYAGNTPYPTNTGAIDPRPQSNTVGFPGQDQGAEAKPNNDYPGRQPNPGGPYPGAGYAGYPAQSGYLGRPGYADPGYRPYPGYKGYYGTLLYFIIYC